mmetsp:Transcript_9715/g.12308  ORF Transcript_9715/g.12308 Transcript_9715/m.12308 type:complete len:376 (-) Transcript_9715:316-1443(-)
MEYCIVKFRSDRNRPINMRVLLGELMTLVFSHFDDYVTRPSSGNLETIKLLRDKYPDTILYADNHEFTPLHGACCALNMEIFKYFLEWHLVMRPEGRGGLYSMNDLGITSLDTLIDTQQNITPALIWLRNRGLLKSSDVDEWLLVHRAAHSSQIRTIRFFLDLYPGAVLLTDDDGNLPMHLHLGLTYRRVGTFSEDDFNILKLLVRYGLIHGGIENLGGLFFPDPDNENRCSLEMVLKEVGEEKHARVWEMIDDAMEYNMRNVEAVFIVHAALSQRQCIGNDLFKEILSRYEVSTTIPNNDGDLPLHYAIKKGLKWNNGVYQVFECHKDALYVLDKGVDLPPFLLAASVQNPDLSTIFELSKRDLGLIMDASVKN